MHGEDYDDDDSWLQMYREHKDMAIEEFRAERLRSFYAANLLVAQPASRALAEARKLVEVGHASAAQVFGAVAVEVGLKVALLKPIVHGLVHSSWAAELVTELVLPARQHTPLDRFKDLLFEILAQLGGIDPRTYYRQGAHATLWQEIKDVQVQRNAIVHHAEVATQAEAELAIGVAEAILEELFRSVILSFRFHLHDEACICRDWRCRDRARKGLWKDRCEPPPEWRL